MRFTRTIAVAMMAAALSVTAATAQIKLTQPAEFPPASYKGKQYVDSKGCVFIRAGIDGNVSWVPRVTRSRSVVCGFAPTDLSGISAAAPAPAAAAPEQITLNDAPAVAPAPRPAVAPAPRPAVAPAPRPAVAPAPRVAATAPRVAAPAAAPRAAAPVVVRQTAPKPEVQPETFFLIVPDPVQEVVAPTPAPKVVTACPGASPISQQYMRANGRYAVRCGPQTQPIVAGNYGTTTVAVAPQPVVTSGGPAVTPAPAESIGDHTRIVPKHVAIRRLNTTDVAVPSGYRPVWDDGRLNPNRAEQSLAGRADMLLIWTNTVPRRLINQATGQDLTASVPLVYPYLDVATQSRDLGEVTIVQRDGQRFKRIVRNSRAAPAARQPVYSSRSTAQTEAVAARSAPVQAPSGGATQYVHIGLFSTQAKAQTAAQSVAGMGMGARIGNVRHNGKSYLSVEAGPFRGANATRSAVSQLRGIGYTGARASN